MVAFDLDLDASLRTSHISDRIRTPIKLLCLRLGKRVALWKDDWDCLLRPEK